MEGQTESGVCFCQERTIRKKERVEGIYEEVVIPDCEI